MRKPFFVLNLIVIFAFLILTACGSNSESTSSSPSDKSSSADSKASNLPALPDDIKKKGKLVIGVKVDFPPFGSMDASGKNVGYDIDFAKKLAEFAFGDANAVEFVPVTSDNRIPFLNSKKVDLLIASLAATDERKKVVDFTDPYFGTSNLTLVKKDSNIKDLKDLEGKTVITLKGSTEALALQKAVPSAQQLQLTTLAEQLQALKDDRGVAMVKDESVLYKIVDQDSSYKIVGEPFEPMAIAAAVRKGDTEYLNWLNAAIKEVSSQDLFYKWFKNWFPEFKNTPQLLPRP
ncbi:transporter substrate-binding domain-containing protein [Neobacillus rhizophilus]|uniref:Transporter substrate-binding domain-containing protein n=1 Tax=Neobacillus rhizophilus TaxID=2833579 RepID=A0A942U190_9BACI|nr:transporter substrate-binding domain-containing protein [Neobacillus rhizophilus]MBS4212706.1 transporter substrate-binding domain-containing protein [Neobacillus rhizophilus]